MVVIQLGPTMCILECIQRFFPNRMQTFLVKEKMKYREQNSLPFFYKEKRMLYIYDIVLYAFSSHLLKDLELFMVWWALFYLTIKPKWYDTSIVS